MTTCKRTACATVWYVPSSQCPLLQVMSRERDWKILGYVTHKTQEGQEVTAKQVSQDLGIPLPHVYTILNRLAQLGFIEKIGSYDAKYRSKCVGTTIIHRNGTIQILNCPRHTEE